MNTALYRAMMQDAPKSPTYSIDAFLEHRPEYIFVGSMMIAINLLQRERTASLFHEIINKRIIARQKKTSAIEDWYQYLFEKMGNSPEEIMGSSLVIITFNYDRSLEHFLFESVKSKFGLSDVTASDVMRTIQFIHLYGSLGKLHWQNGEMPIVPYDSWADQGQRITNIEKAASSIKILREGDSADKSPEFKLAHKHIEEAEKVLFLGFAFDPVNVKRLLPEPLIKKDNIYGTSLGLDVHRKIDLINMGLRDMKDKDFFPGTTILNFLTQYTASGLR